MADISGQALYLIVCRALGQGQGNDATAFLFPFAVNCALDDLGNAADASTEFTHIAQTDDDIGLDDNYTYIMLAGVTYYMIRMGISPGDPRVARVAYEDSERRWLSAKADYVVALDNATQATATNDVVKLGYVGDS